MIEADGAPSAVPPAASTSSCHVHNASLIPSAGPQCLAKLLVIREGQHLVAYDLTGFMAFAGDDEHIALLEHGDAGADRLRAVADLARAFRTGQDLGADRLGLLGARDCRR